MATKSKKRRDLATKIGGATRSERIRQGLLDWHSASYGSLDRMLEVANDLLDELKDDDSPLHEFIENDCALQELATALDEASWRMVSLFQPLIPLKESDIPNPTDLI